MLQINCAKTIRLIILCFVSIHASLQAWYFDIVPVKELIQQHPEVEYQQCFNEAPFSFESFSPDPSYPNKGTFKECFVLTIPYGIVQSQYGYTLVGKKFIRELIWGDQENILSTVADLGADSAVKIHGRMAVITQVAYPSYSHWLNEILARLSILEMHNVQYDWLYVQKGSQERNVSCSRNKKPPGEPGGFSF